MKRCTTQKIICSFILVFASILYIVQIKHTASINNIPLKENKPNTVEHISINFTNKNITNAHYITFHGTHGFGSQMSSRIYTMMYTKHHYDYTYCHTPFFSNNFHYRHIPSKYANRKEWMDAIDNFFNLGYGEIYCKDLNRTKRVPKKGFKTKVAKNMTYYFTNESVQYLRSKYFAQKRMFNISIIEGYEADHFNIAVHIRRGDAATVKREKWRASPDEYYLSVIQHVLQVTAHNVQTKVSKQVDLHILSESRGFDELNFTKLLENVIINSVDDDMDVNYYYHLDMELEPTIHTMIISDALIISKSSLSYVCALFSNSQHIFYPVIYWPFNAPLPHWKHVYYNTNAEEVHNCDRINTWNMSNGFVAETTNCTF